MADPVTVVIAWGTEFHEHLPRLFPQADIRSGVTPHLRGDSRRHSFPDVRNARNNAALHKAETAVPSHKAAEIE
jgi:hypothetical protein